MPLQKAYEYFDNVLEHKQAIPFRRFNGGVGRTPQVNHLGTTQGRWPVKSVKFLRDLLKNAESNAEAKDMDAQTLIIRNIVVQQAPTTYRRTYRAHGRINPYRSNPCHIEILLASPAEQVQKTKSVVPVRLRRRSKCQGLDDVWPPYVFFQFLRWLASWRAICVCLYPGIG